MKTSVLMGSWPVDHREKASPLSRNGSWLGEPPQLDVRPPEQPLAASASSSPAASATLPTTVNQAHGISRWTLNSTWRRRGSFFENTFGKMCRRAPVGLHCSRTVCTKSITLASRRQCSLNAHSRKLTRQPHRGRMSKLGANTILRQDPKSHRQTDPSSECQRTSMSLSTHSIEMSYGNTYLDLRSRIR
jgi:hypothetical protein